MQKSKKKTEQKGKKYTSKLPTEASRSTPKRRKSRRAADPHAALEVKYTLKSRIDLVDYDYIGKLSKEEKDWLAKFTEEEIHAKLEKNTTKNFNKTDSERKAIYDRNNARNRCTWTREKAKGMANYLEDYKDTLLSNNPEEFIAVKMDLEAQGWVNSNGDVLITEEELIDQLKEEEKQKRILLRQTKKKPISKKEK